MVMFGPTKGKKLRGKRRKKAHVFLRRLDQEGILVRTLRGDQWRALSPIDPDHTLPKHKSTLSHHWPK